MRIFKTTKTGYRFDKRIFWGIILIALSIFLYSLYKNNFDLSYKLSFDCKTETCENPYYSGNVYASTILGNVKCNYDWCKQKYLNKGFYGEKPPIILNYFTIIILSLCIIGLCLNHFLYNKGKPLNIEIDGVEELKEKYNKLRE
jgi:hypothetical protein